MVIKWYWNDQDDHRDASHFIRCKTWRWNSCCLGLPLLQRIYGFRLIANAGSWEPLMNLDPVCTWSILEPHRHQKASMLGEKFCHAPSTCRERFIGLLWVLAGEANARLTGIHPFRGVCLKPLGCRFRFGSASWTFESQTSIKDGQNRKTYIYIYIIYIYTCNIYIHNVYIYIHITINCHSS